MRKPENPMQDLNFPGGSVRSWKTGDLEAMVRLGDNPKVWHNLRDSFPNPYTRPAAKAWLREVMAMSPLCHFAITVDGQVAGGIGLQLQQDIHRLSAELGYWLGEPFWGRGLMTRAVAAFAERAFEAFRLERVYAVVLEWNPASARVLEKAGFALEGRLRKSAVKDGVVLDELLYARICG